MRYAALSMALGAFLFAADNKLLFDFRPSEGKTDPSRTLSAEARRNILSAVFPRYLRDETQCKLKESPPDLEAARKAGQVVPEVLSQAAGSFTRSSARQTAYLIKVGECGAQGASYFGTYRLVVFENGRMIGGGQSPGADYIYTVADVVGDGIEELLISGCDFGQGVSECSARLVSIAGGSLTTMQEFPFVYTDQCESSLQDSRISASVIRYARGHPPQFFLEEYEAACPASGKEPQFRPAAAGKF